MTLLNGPTTATRRRSIRNHPASGGGVDAMASARWGARAAWTIVWLLALPMLVGYYVVMQGGDVWGVIPAFWLDDPAAVFLPVAPAMAVVSTFAVCLVMQRKQLDLPFGLLPMLGAAVAYYADLAGWIGLLGGLAVGAVVFIARRRR